MSYDDVRQIMFEKKTEMTYQQRRREKVKGKAKTKGREKKKDKEAGWGREKRDAGEDIQEVII